MSFDHESAYDVLSHSWHPVDHRSPLDDLIEAEEADDAAEDADASRLNDIPPDALLTILRFLIPPIAEGRSPGKRWRKMQLRTIVLAHACGLESVADKTLAELAAELGVTRALMSLYAVRLTDELGQEQVRGGKRRESRETYRKSSIAAHRRAGHTMKEHV